MEVFIALIAIACTCIIVWCCCMSNTDGHTKKPQVKAEKSKQFHSSDRILLADQQLEAKKRNHDQFFHDGPTKEKADNLIKEWKGKKKEEKPTQFIGRLMYYTEEDREGLKQLKNNGFELKVRKEEADKVHPKYATYLEEYFTQLNNDGDIVTIAHAELNVTHITTDKGNLYRSTRYKHAEIVLIERTEPQDVHKIWIENSPCTECSPRLVEHFKQESKKPTICVGKLYEEDKDGNGIKLLMTSGFTLQPWEKYIEYAGWNVEKSPITKKIKELTNHQAST